MMSFQLVDRDGFAHASLHGLVSLEAWQAVLGQLAAELVAAAAPSRLVIDMTAVMGYLGVPERRAVGGLMAQHFGGLEKVAIVVQAQKITGVVSSEARSRGLDLQLFPDPRDAVAWVNS